MIEREVEYLKQRVQAEALRALEAQSRVVADAHHMLAAVYTERLAMLERGDARAD